MYSDVIKKLKNRKSLGEDGIPNVRTETQYTSVDQATLTPNSENLKANPRNFRRINQLNTLKLTTQEITNKLTNELNGNITIEEK